MSRSHREKDDEGAREIRIDCDEAFSMNAQVATNCGVADPNARASDVKISAGCGMTPK